MTAWRKAAGCESVACIEVHEAAGDIYIQATAMPQIRPGVTVATRAEFAAFVDAVKAGEFDGLANP